MTIIDRFYITIENCKAKKIHITEYESFCYAIEKNDRNNVCEY
jgi:hypothetical protein